ncbi:hypothetical protein, partial [Celeribacter halophilus]|uniref:hypothetical protein n=1 Tax=Celeribacter halophilus TaxID=576117 RepID=UPI003A90BC72
VLQHQSNQMHRRHSNPSDTRFTHSSAYYTALQSFDNDYAGLSRTGLAAVRHENLDLAGFCTTNRMTGLSPKQT